MAIDPDPEGEEDPQVKQADLQAKVLALESDLSGAKMELATRVKHYDSKLLTMSVINNALQNENEKLKEEAAKVHLVGGIDHDLAELQEEFTRRLGAADRTAANMKEECFTLRQRVEDLKKGKEGLMKELEEKQRSIEQYVSEGESLSIKIGELEGILKRCHVDLTKAEQEKEKLFSHVQTLEGVAKESELNRSVNVAEANQALQQTKQIGQSAGYAKHFIDEHSALEETRKQCEEEIQVIRQDWSAEVARLSHQIKEREKSWANNLDDLRTSLTKSSETASEREESLREEMRKLEDRCRTAEAAQQEATTGLSEAAIPLMRQLTQREAVTEERERQQHYQIQQLEAAIASTMNLLKEAETRAATSEKKAEYAESALNELEAKVASAFDKLQGSDKEIAALKGKVLEAEVELAASQTAQIELEEKLLLAEENLSLAEKAQDKAAGHFLVEQAAKEEVEQLLEQAKLDLAEADGVRLQFETLKTSLAEQERVIRARMVSLRRASIGENGADDTIDNDTTKSMSNFRDQSPSMNGSSAELLPDLHELDRFKGGLSPSPMNMERLVSEVRRLQGEVAQLHKDLKAAESACDHASEDLLKATEKLNAIEKDSASAPKLRKELEELKKRHEMALVIIGEMNEKSDELEADIADVKTLYREQMNLLISQVTKSLERIGCRRESSGKCLQSNVRSNASLPPLELTKRQAVYKADWDRGRKLQGMSFISDQRSMCRLVLSATQIDPERWPDGYRICLFCSHCAQEQRRTKRAIK